MRPKRSTLAAQILGTSLAIAASGLFPSASQQTSSGAGLSPRELAGKKLFLQRCSICHLPPINVPQERAPEPPGPRLDGSIRGVERETRAREIIRNGSSGMPGFQHSLQPKQIDDLIAYLKTL